MSKWRLWEDQYLGDEWNDRYEISTPQFEGMEMDDDKVEEELLSYFMPEVRDMVEVDGDTDFMAARLSICATCGKVWPCGNGEHEDFEEHGTIVGFHAERKDDDL